MTIGLTWRRTARRIKRLKFEGGCFNHFSRLLGSPDPDFLALSQRSCQVGVLRNRCSTRTTNISCNRQRVKTFGSFALADDIDYEGGEKHRHYGG
jgi:hypothetical protein